MAPSIRYAYETMISNNLLVHLYPTQGEAHSITREGQSIFEIYISKLDSREVNNCLML